MFVLFLTWGPSRLNFKDIYRQNLNKQREILNQRNFVLTFSLLDKNFLTLFSLFILFVFVLKKYKFKQLTDIFIFFCIFCNIFSRNCHKIKRISSNSQNLMRLNMSTKWRRNFVLFFNVFYCPDCWKHWRTAFQLLWRPPGRRPEPPRSAPAWPPLRRLLPQRLACFPPCCSVCRRAAQEKEYIVEKCIGNNMDDKRE